MTDYAGLDVSQKETAHVDLLRLSGERFGSYPAVLSN
jgi:hypothetical protein